MSWRLSRLHNADGKRVKVTYTTNGTPDSTMNYVGGYYEQNMLTLAITKYYRAGGALVAMRQGAARYELLSDPLGSVSVSYPVGGAATCQRYLPCPQGVQRGGEIRYTPAS